MLRKCLKIVCALLAVLAVEQGVSQSVDYTVTQTPVGAPLPLELLNQNQGTALNLGDDSVAGPVNLGFTFTFYGQEFSSTWISSNGVIGFQGAINGCCNGYDLSSSGNNYGIFALQTDLLNIDTANPYYRLSGTEGSREFTVGWYDMPVFADSNFRNTFEITLYEGSNNILLNYGDLNLGGRSYTAGIKGANGEYETIHFGTGDLLEYTSFTLSSGPPPPPPVPVFLYWNKLVDENSSFTLTEPGVVRYGASGSYIYQEFQPGTYECSNSAWGMDPIGGVFKSCELGSNVLPEEKVDCATDPTDPSCVIDSILDDFIPDPTEEQPMLADETGSDDGSSDGTEAVEEEDDTPVADTVEETETLEELLQDDAADDTLVADDTDSGDTVERTAEPVATVAAIADESKANELADSISKNVLEGALAIATDAAAAGGSTAVASDTQSSTRTAAATTTNTVSATQETAVSETKVEENKVDSSESAVAALELLDTGRQMGRDALTTTMAATEQSAQESVAQAESIAAASSETQNTNTTVAETVSTSSVEDTSSALVAAGNEQTVDEIRETRTEFESTAVETTTEIDIVTASAAETAVETTDTGTTFSETAVEVNETENTVETVVADTQAVEQTDSFADIMNLEIRTVEEVKDEDVEFVQQVLAASEQQRQQEETNNTGFSEEEKITIQSDPALANAFNVVPNVSNLEAAGVLNQRQEEKSDAEKRADEVVAANAKEQEEINKNYMDADQSGIVAAIGADTDVGAYRSAMLQDNNTWYKPEDIYKNVVYKDNVRGAYFLEKGNTDTYKKMVEEQYR